VRGLLVDFGGVLTTNVFQSFREFSEREGLDPDHVKEKFRSDPEALGLLRRLEKGEVDIDEFEPAFAAAIGVDDHSGLVERLFRGIGPDEPMVEAVRAARRSGVRTGLISNSWGSGLQYDDSLMDELFDAVVISGDVGLHKPQPEIFELGASRIGVPPADCVFVDDLRENCEGAEEVGMTAIRFRDPAQTIARLSELTGLALAPT
jgi:epoxide hydrolase-like predicted phosphatase